MMPIVQDPGPPHDPKLLRQPHTAPPPPTLRKMISKIELNQVNFITDKVVVSSDSDYGTN